MKQKPRRMASNGKKKTVPAPAREAPLRAADLRDIAAISVDTVERFTTYVALLEKWQRSMNLVGPATLADVWRRHILDSAQLHPHLPGSPAAAEPVVLDMGSGAGFPGLVLAIMGGCRVHLVESNARKCAFLAEVNRATGAGASIHNQRIESLAPMAADVVTARACAPLETLLGYAERHLTGGGFCLFPKGRTAQRELTESMKTWMMRVTRVPSLTDPSGTILKLEEISRRHG